MKRETSFRGQRSLLRPGRTLKWVACAALLCQVGALSAQQIKDRATCTPLSADNFAGEPVALPTLAARRWSDRCYADARIWLEPDEAARDSGKFDALQRVIQRFDLWAADTPSAPRPLIVFAHPARKSEDLAPGDVLDQQMLSPALSRGYAVASVEYFHPLVSVDKKRVADSLADIRQDDIAQAVQYFRHHATLLNIDPANIFLVGQSRGSLVVLSGVLPDRQVPGAPDWRAQSSAVRAVFSYQSQTSYETQEIADTFIKSGKSRNTFLCNQAYVTWSPGSAVDLVKNQGVPMVPMRLNFDERRSGPDVVKQCYNQKEVNGCPIVKCIDTPIFDVHDNNYGVALEAAYAQRNAALPPEQRVPLSQCFGVGPARRGYFGLMDYLEVYRLGGPGGVEPGC